MRGWTRTTTWTLALVVAGCGQRAEPTAPAETTPAGELTASAAQACPCWGGEALAGEFPSADFWADADLGRGRTQSLQRFDVAARSQTEALLDFGGDGRPATCRLARFGTQGLSEVVARADSLSGAATTACAALLADRAAALGR